MHIVELQRKLQTARNDAPLTKVRMRTAAIDDASTLLKSGLFSPEEISYFQGLPLSVVKSEQARLEELEQSRRRYLSSLKMELPGEMAHFTIFQR